MTQNVMTYRGYAASVAYDDGDGVFIGKVLDIGDTLLFSGESVDELRSSFRSLIDDYLAYCERTGESPDRPFSGRVQLRLSPQQHRDAVVAAASRDQSLNAILVDAVSSFLTSLDDEAREGGPVIDFQRLAS